MQLTITDHPRRCGENPPVSAFSSVHLGSPPQVRGKRTLYCFTNIRAGITPAGAGKTVREIKRDYMQPGSPPQVRGKQGKKAAKKIPDRITPAGAGKTCLTR